MRKTLTLLALAVGVAASPFPSLIEPAAAQTPAGALKVTIRYTGPGQVDAGHRVFVWLFDSPLFLSGDPSAMPVAVQTLARNGGDVIFPSVAAERVWVTVVFDQAGGYIGNGPPPSGSPATTYTEDGEPAPVTPGGSAAVAITFDDSYRLPESRR
jgi:hypothetical protein